MPEEIEIETKELQEAVAELHKEHEEHEKEAKESSWTRFIALSTAILAVFAAVAALQSGSLANQAVITELKAADTWNEYQADRQKDHLYTLQVNALLDSGAKPAPSTPASHGAVPAWAAMPTGARITQYLGEIDKEVAKEANLSKGAQDYEKLSERQMQLHEFFAHSVALIQVAIALSAVAALTKNRPVWYVSLAAGAIGIVLFILGFL